MSTASARPCSVTPRRAATTRCCWLTALCSVGKRRCPGSMPGIQTVVCGHTHMQFDRLAAGRRVVNPGSVGMPYGPPGAHWALLGPGAWLRRTRYDTAAAARVIAAGRYLSAGEWAREYVLHH